MAEAAQAPDPLAGLIDIPLPPPVSLLPQTWPERIAIVLEVAGLIAGVWWFVRWWRANRYRRAALAELAGIERAFTANSAGSLPLKGGGLGWGSHDLEQAPDPHPARKSAPTSPLQGEGESGARTPIQLDTQTVSHPVKALALLVRRTALAAFPRQQVASLAGPAWLAFLDRTYGGQEFSQGPGQILGLAPYEPQRSISDMRPLIDLVRRWIRTHHD